MPLALGQRGTGWTETYRGPLCGGRPGRAPRLLSEAQGLEQGCGDGNRTAVPGAQLWAAPRLSCALGVPGGAVLHGACEAGGPPSSRGKQALEGEGTPPLSSGRAGGQVPGADKPGRGGPGCWDQISSNDSERPAVRAGQAPVRTGQARRRRLAVGVEADTGLMSPSVLSPLMKALGSGCGVFSEGAGGGQVLGFEPQGVFSAGLSWGGLCRGEGRSMSLRASSQGSHARERASP